MFLWMWLWSAPIMCGAMVGWWVRSCARRSAKERYSMLDERAESIQALVAEWMRWARSDLTVASMSDDERIAPEILAFHAQQAAEKALKALLIRYQVEFPRTHAIGPLLNLCEASGSAGI